MRKELSKVDVKMTVKFLYPHLNRGDLYTKQGILCMLQAGIKVKFPKTDVTTKLKSI